LFLVFCQLFDGPALIRQIDALIEPELAGVLIEFPSRAGV
jgi:hypothetical protein